MSTWWVTCVPVQTAMSSVRTAGSSPEPSKVHKPPSLLSSNSKLNIPDVSHTSILTEIFTLDMKLSRTVCVLFLFPFRSLLTLRSFRMPFSFVFIIVIRVLLYFIIITSFIYVFWFRPFCFRFSVAADHFVLIGLHSSVSFLSSYVCLIMFLCLSPLLYIIFHIFSVTVRGFSGFVLMFDPWCERWWQTRSGQTRETLTLPSNSQIIEGFISGTLFGFVVVWTTAWAVSWWWRA